MAKFAIASGDGNMGVSHIFPDFIGEGDEINSMLNAALAQYAQYGEPDAIDGDAEGGYSLVWYEIDGAPALNDGAALIVDVFPFDD